MEKRILIVPIGEIETELLDWLKVKLEEKFLRKVEILSEMKGVDYTYNPKRNQYYSTAILKRLAKIERNKEDFILGIIDKDLYVPELNFVFGEADVINKVAIIGLSRLREEFYGLSPNRNIFLERVLKEAVHEIGHLYGFGHCLNPNCVMFFSNSLSDTDRKSSNFCSKHKIRE